MVELEEKQIPLTAVYAPACGLYGINLGAICPIPRVILLTLPLTVRFAVLTHVLQPRFQRSRHYSATSGSRADAASKSLKIICTCCEKLSRSGQSSRGATM